MMRACKKIHDDSMNDFTTKSIHFRSKSYLISHLKMGKVKNLPKNPCNNLINILTWTDKEIGCVLNK